MGAEAKRIKDGLDQLEKNVQTKVQRWHGLQKLTGFQPGHACKTSLKDTLKSKLSSRSGAQNQILSHK